MATKKETTEVMTDEKVEISKSQLDELLAGYDDMKNQIAVLTKQAATENKVKSAESKKIEEEQRLLDIVHVANTAAEEEVEIHVDVGSLRSNKNAEVSINGVQSTIPKGIPVKVKKNVAEIIENSKKQREISLGLQNERNAEYQKAEDEGFFN